MSTLNETAADIGGKELGDLVFEFLGGEIPKPVAATPSTDDPNSFDFNTTKHDISTLVSKLKAFIESA